MSKNKNANLLELGGYTGISDAEYAATLGIDPSLIGTPSFNKAIFDRVEEMNVAAYMKAGMTKEQAHKRAAKRKADAMAAAASTNS